jgi:single-stranded DNA-binding protein
VLNLRVAVAQRRDRDNADWYSVTAWEGLAETLAVTLDIGQGDLVYVAGDLGIDHYTDRAGVACSAPVITARDVQLLARARRDEPRDTHATRRTRTDPRRTQQPTPEQRHQSITDAPPRSYRQP